MKTTVAILCSVCVVVVLSSFQSHYELLGVPKTAGLEEIKKAFRTESLKYHPDKNPDNEDALQRFLILVEAYETLSDSQKRSIYDEDLRTGRAKRPSSNSYGRASASWQPEGRGGDGMPMETSFDHFIKFAKAKFEFHFEGKKKPRSAGNVQQDIVLRLEDVLQGKRVNITASRTRVCPHCSGTGASETEHLFTCPKCFGTGYRFTRGSLSAYSKSRRAPNNSSEVPTQFLHSLCDECDGRGSTYNRTEHTCPVCQGNRIVHDEYRDTLFISPGVKSGETIIIPGEGNSFPDSSYSDGNLLLRIIIADHPRFQREDSNLLVTMQLSLIEALLGFERNLTLLDNEELLIESKDIVRPSERRVFPSYGLPCYNKDCIGNLIVIFDVEFPDSLSDEDRNELAHVLDAEELQRIERMISEKADRQRLRDERTRYVGTLDSLQFDEAMRRALESPHVREGEKSFEEAFASKPRNVVVSHHQLFAPTTGLLREVKGICPERCPPLVFYVLQRIPNFNKENAGLYVRAKGSLAVRAPKGQRAFNASLSDPDQMFLRLGDLIGWTEPTRGGAPSISLLEIGGEARTASFLISEKPIQEKSMMKGASYRLVAESPVSSPSTILTPLISITIEEGVCRRSPGGAKLEKADCSGHGECVDSVCRCEPPFFGLHCDVISVGRLSRTSSVVEGFEARHGNDGVRLSTASHAEREPASQSPVLAAKTQAVEGELGWWELDFQREYVISGVRVTAVEGEEWALSSAEVLVSRSPIANLVEDERGAVREQDIARIKESEEIWRSGPLSISTETPVATVPATRIVRYVRLQLMAPNARMTTEVSLAELEVFHA